MSTRPSSSSPKAHSFKAVSKSVFLHPIHYLQIEIKGAWVGGKAT